MPFPPALADVRHREARSVKRLIHLITHLEAVQADARSYLCRHILGLRAIGCAHLGKRLLCNAADGATPTCMNGSNGAMATVVKEYGNAVCRAHADAHPSQVRHHRIDALKLLHPLCSRALEERLVNPCHLCAMYLMGQDQPLVTDAQRLTQQPSVHSYRLLVVPTILVDVERRVVPHAASPVPRRAETHHVLVQVIIN